MWVISANIRKKLNPAKKFLCPYPSLIHLLPISYPLAGRRRDHDATSSFKIFSNLPEKKEKF
jgi:hypothetical protein